MELTPSVKRPHGAREAKNVTRVASNDIPERLNALSEMILTEWQTSFVNSVRASFQRYGYLTEGQYKTLMNVWDANSPETKRERAQWLAEWDEDKKKKFERIVRYYAGTNYFKGTVLKVFNASAKNSEYIPTRKEYTNITENKWAKKLLALDATPKKFAAGDLVCVNDGYAYDSGTVGGVVTRVNDEYTRPFEGFRSVSVHYVFGKPDFLPDESEHYERDLKAFS
jgi:hypothetical protein